MAKGKGFRSMSMDFPKGGGKSSTNPKSVGQQKAGGTATKGASGPKGFAVKAGPSGKVAGFHPVGKSKAGQTGTR